ncbi:GH12818 [Drosophila grimshawi]|uniref:GH12818 n=1 Tax=Drosophila grimshawi TaxID=7222 RepID=B4JLA0_DROGR|nr:GH12818 [Drosophila grimshawi]
MALFPSSSRPRTLMEQLLARKIEAAAAAGSGAGSANAASGSGSIAGSSSIPLPASTTAAAAAAGSGAASIVSRLRRTDSLDSTSSLGSLAFGEDVCRCDDCLLGIVDLYVISAAEAAKKKVGEAQLERRWGAGFS